MVEKNDEERIKDVLRAWTSATSRYIELPGYYPGSQLYCLKEGRKQVADMLRCIEEGDYEGARRAYGGAYSNFWDAGYDDDTKCGAYTLEDFRFTVGVIEKIASGVGVKDE